MFIWYKGVKQKLTMKWLANVSFFCCQSKHRFLQKLCSITVTIHSDIEPSRFDISRIVLDSFRWCEFHDETLTPYLENEWLFWLLVLLAIHVLVVILNDSILIWVRKVFWWIIWADSNLLWAASAWNETVMSDSWL